MNIDLILCTKAYRTFIHIPNTYSYFNQGCPRAKRKSRIRERKACWESLKNLNFLAIPSKPFALVFDFPALLGDNLN